MFLCRVFLMLSRLFRADLLALVGDDYCIFVTLPCGVLGQVWYLIVSIPDLCLLTYFVALGYFPCKVLELWREEANMLLYYIV